jgi:hypothetical protein
MQMYSNVKPYKHKTSARIIKPHPAMSSALCDTTSAFTSISTIDWLI